MLDPDLATGVVRGNVIIAGGGTGGHIYPGIAIARAVEKLYPALKVHFVGATGGLEEIIVPREGFPLHVVPVGKLHHSVGVVTRLKTLLKMPLTMWKAFRILRELNPVAVLGVGGFASGPILFLASVFRYRSLIWEPNAYPGLANRMLSRWADESLLVFEEAGKHLKSRHQSMIGLPVRSSMMPVLRTSPRTVAEPLRILVFGGSQGARFINKLVSQALRVGEIGTGEEGGKEVWMSGVEVVHQTGPADFAAIQEAYQGAPPSYSVHQYLHDMDQRYAWADLVVCRSGASTVAEICACRKASIFIPLPTAADDHQRKNAEVLSKADAAMMLLQSELTPESFRATLRRFRDDRSLIARYEENVVKFQYPNAAEKIAERLVAGATV